MDGHVAKPVDFATLMRAITGAIARTPSDWTTDGAAASLAEQDDQPPPMLDRAVLDRLLEFLPPEEFEANLRSLRARKEQMLQLMDRPVEDTADPAATRAVLSEAAHALASTAGMFGFMALSMAARRFERAVAADAAAPVRLARQLYEEIRAALARLNSLMRANRMQSDEVRAG